MLFFVNSRGLIPRPQLRKSNTLLPKPPPVTSLLIRTSIFIPYSEQDYRPICYGYVGRVVRLSRAEGRPSGSVSLTSRCTRVGTSRLARVSSAHARATRPTKELQITQCVPTSSSRRKIRWTRRRSQGATRPAVAPVYNSGQIVRCIHADVFSTHFENVPEDGTLLEVPYLRQWRAGIVILRMIKGRSKGL